MDETVHIVHVRIQMDKPEIWTGSERWGGGAKEFSHHPGSFQDTPNYEELLRELATCQGEKKVKLFILT